MPSPATKPRSYAQLCGIAAALDVVGDRWSALVVRDLLLGPLRFGELAEGLPGIGTNTLTTRLKQLESCGVVHRRLLDRPDRGTVYELTAYGRELEPVLLALGRWGTKSMGRLPADVTSRSRWLVAAMLAFHDGRRRVPRATTWELRLTDGVFTVRSVGKGLTVLAGAADHPDLVITVEDEDLHRLLTHRIDPAEAVAVGLVTLHGDPTAFARLIDLFAFPDLDPTATS